MVDSENDSQSELSPAAGYPPQRQRLLDPLAPAEAALNLVIPAEQLRPGQSALISDIVGRPDHVRRLKEFGLQRGTKVEMFRRGNPCILRLHANKLCLRSDDLLDILVTPVETPEGSDLHAHVL